MRAFIIRPFGVKPDRKGGVIDFDAVEANLIGKALEAVRCFGRTTQDIASAGNIREDMFRLLVTADLVIADISIHNANVFYELGIRHALRDRRTFLIRCNADAPVFDLQTERYLEYDREHPEKTLPALIAALRQTLDADKKDSPVFSLLPNLEVPRRAFFLLVPRDFADEVERAKADRRTGDLALLAHEACGFEWESEGLRVVGEAQFDLKDYEGARVTWEQVRDLENQDLDANTRLGTIYQRLGDLTRSDQALRRALDHVKALPLDRAELRSLLGRNAKTQWVAEWRAAPESERRAAALRSGWLDQARKAYADGFAEDLNHFYSGLNALALLTVELELATALPEVWGGQFFDADEADAERRKRTKQARQLAEAVDLSLRAASARLERENRTDVWTAVSEVDLRCLTVDAPAQVAQAYQRALTGAPDFVVDAARDQLRLYRELGVRAANVEAALKLFPPEQAGPTCSVDTKLRVLLFTGHMIDAPGRTTPRFPADREAVARQAIKDVVARELAEPGGTCIGIAGGASGGDILFHEVCGELGIRTELYIAVPRDQFIAESVTPAGPGWVERFRTLYDRLSKHQLAESKDLPRWLRGKANYDIWQRNNLWMLYNVLALRRDRLTLIALWDGKTGDAPGGTEHMLEKARARGAKPVVLRTQEVFGLAD